MGENNFNGRQCARALIKLGFIFNTKRRGKHDKYKAPFPAANPPFIMIPRHKNIHCQEEIIKEIKKIGGDELVEKFREYL
jgi:predicted RNA binding protein YcfA (HicA-like mRNA interferase family)